MMYPTYPRRHSQHLQRGVTLLELSIVIVIIGLITGGVLLGKELIRGAEIKSITSDLDTYKRAITTFAEKYNQLPGDMSNATTFWGAANAVHATCIITQGTGTQTCNGDGNRKIGVWPAAGIADTFERFRLWQHLAISGIIPGTYTGISGPLDASSDYIAGENMPRSKAGGAAITLTDMDTITADADFYDAIYGHTFHLLRRTASGHQGFLEPSEAQSLDTKFDDGKPGTGSILAQKMTATAAPGCTTSDDRALATYAITSSGTICTFLMKVSF